MDQLTLPVSLSDSAVFENFYSRGNEQSIKFLKNLTDEKSGNGCMLWGRPSTGKTHLLQAVCSSFGESGIYLPMQDLLMTDPKILEGIEQRKCICLDDINVCVGKFKWEKALFNLFNNTSEYGSMFVISAPAPPRDLRFLLSDLQSRYSLLTIFHLCQLSESGRQKALQLRAMNRGLILPDETAHYLLRRGRRDMRSLYELLDKLDNEALVAKRKLTIPFVKSVMNF